MSSSQTQVAAGRIGNGRPQNKKQPKQCANPVFEQWLVEWREEAVQKNSKMQYVYSKALNSLRKYPLPLSSGRECIMLEYFGNTLCQMIDARLSKEPEIQKSLSETTRLGEILELSSLPLSKPKSKKAKSALGNKSEEADDAAIEEPVVKTIKKPKGKAKYVPAYRSGPYALLVAIFKKEQTPGYRGYMLKSELMREAQEYCDSSFTKSDNHNKYTAWNAMTMLVNKELVLRQEQPPKFLLTIEGRKLAAKLLNVTDPVGNLAATEVESNDEDDGEEAEIIRVSQNHTRFVLEPGEFEVILVVDNSETIAKGKKDDVIGELQKNGVPIQVMKLNIGDFVWICRKKDLAFGQQSNQRRLTVSRPSQSLVLPYAVERKRADDLAHSIKDGRFHEQKHRLEKCYLQPIYLMEAYGNGDWGLAEGALTQALANTQITNNFFIQQTASIKDTCAYLTLMTRHLSKLYSGKRVSSCTREEWPGVKNLAEAYLINFEDFNEFSNKAKDWTVSEMFAKHLLRLKGLSVERAQAIVKRYPTLKTLLLSYDECENEKEREALLSNLHFGFGGRTIGPSISKAICKLYTTKGFP